MKIGYNNGNKIQVEKTTDITGPNVSAMINWFTGIPLRTLSSFFSTSTVASLQSSRPYRTGVAPSIVKTINKETLNMG